MSSTGRFMLKNSFFSAPEVGRLLCAEPRGATSAIGVWMLMGSYHAAYPGYSVPHGCRRLCGAKPKDIKTLIAHGFLIESEGREWRLGYEGYLWDITYSRDGSRATIATSTRTVVMERDGFACVECGADQDLTLDHIIPWSHGGPDTVGNLRVLCRSCNSSRGNRVAVDG